MSSHRRPDTRRLPAACPRCLRNLRLCFGAARSGISATLLGQVLCQAAGSDLIPELAGGGAPLGQIGAEAMHRLGAGAALTRDELETVVFNVARAAADLKAAGRRGPCRRGQREGAGPRRGRLRG